MPRYMMGDIGDVYPEWAAAHEAEERRMKQSGETQTRLSDEDLRKLRPETYPSAKQALEWVIGETLARGADLRVALERAEQAEADAAAAREAALEEAALLADRHWPESGHVHQDDTVSCQMTISIEIRRLKQAYKAIERRERPE